MEKILLGALLLAGAAAAAGEEKVSVYVAAATEEEAGVTTARPAERADSVNDLREQIEKRKLLQPAADAGSADITLTVLDRRIEVARSGINYGGGHTQSHYESRYIISYRMKAGEATVESEYYLSGSLVTWRRVAAGLSKEIERWVKDHQEELRQWRKKGEK